MYYLYICKENGLFLENRERASALRKKKGYSNWQGREQIVYVGLSQFQRIIFFCTGNEEIFFSDWLS